MDDRAGISILSAPHRARGGGRSRSWRDPPAHHRRDRRLRLRRAEQRSALADRDAPAEFGPEISDYVRLTLPAVERIGENSLRGVVLKVDKFGNMITNISEQEAPVLFANTPLAVSILVAGQTITHVCRSYAEGGEDEFFAIVGSSGYLEIAAKQASAAEKLASGVGTPVGVVLGA